MMHSLFFGAVVYVASRFDLSNAVQIFKTSTSQLVQTFDIIFKCVFAMLSCTLTACALYTAWRHLISFPRSKITTFLSSFLQYQEVLYNIICNSCYCSLILISLYSTLFEKNNPSV